MRAAKAIKSMAADLQAKLEATRRELYEVCADLEQARVELKRVQASNGVEVIRQSLKAKLESIEDPSVATATSGSYATWELQELLESLNNLPDYAW